MLISGISKGAEVVYNIEKIDKRDVWNKNNTYI